MSFFESESTGRATQNMDVYGYQNKLDIHTGRSDFNFHKKDPKNWKKEDYISLERLGSIETKILGMSYSNCI